MARPKKGVTPKNLLYVEDYFSRAFQADRLSGQGWFKSWNAYYDAKETYKKIPHYHWTAKDTKTVAKRCAALQKWIDQYIPNSKWQRCLLTIRQAKSRKKLKLRQLNLRSDVYLTVKILADKKGITMGEIIKKLTEPALQKIYDKEFEAEYKMKRNKNNSSKTRK